MTTRTRSPSGVRRRRSGMPACSTTRAETGRSAWPAATCTRPRTRCGSTRWRSRAGSRSRCWRARCAARRRTTSSTPRPGCGAWPTRAARPRPPGRCASARCGRTRRTCSRHCSARRSWCAAACCRCRCERSTRTGAERARRVLEAIAGPLPDAAPAPRRTGATRRGLRVAPRGVHDGRAQRGGGDVVTTADRPTLADRVWDGAGAIADPEIPAISLVDLGVIGSVDVDATRVRVELLPTFVGCPAIGIMRQQIGERIGAWAGRRVEVEVSFDPPWTSDRITPAGRERLRLQRLRAAGSACPTVRRWAARRAGRPADRGVPVLRLAQHDAGEPVRPDAVPRDLPLRRLPPAVRAVQARLTRRAGCIGRAGHDRSRPPAGSRARTPRSPHP